MIQVNMPMIIKVLMQKNAQIKIVKIQQIHHILKIKKDTRKIIHGITNIVFLHVQYLLQLIISVMNNVVQTMKVLK